MEDQWHGLDPVCRTYQALVGEAAHSAGSLLRTDVAGSDVHRIVAKVVTSRLRVRTRSLAEPL